MRGRIICLKQRGREERRHFFGKAAITYMARNARSLGKASFSDEHHRWMSLADIRSSFNRDVVHHFRMKASVWCLCFEKYHDELPWLLPCFALFNFPFGFFGPNLSLQPVSPSFLHLFRAVVLPSFSQSGNLLLTRIIEISPH